MKKTITALAAALVLFSVHAPAHAGGKGRNIAKGIAIGLGVGLVAAAVAGGSRSGYAASSPRSYPSYGGGGYCRELRFLCREGSDRACYKYETRC